MAKHELITEHLTPEQQAQLTTFGEGAAQPDMYAGDNPIAEVPLNGQRVGSLIGDALEADLNAATAGHEAKAHRPVARKSPEAPAADSSEQDKGRFLMRVAAWAERPENEHVSQPDIRRGLGIRNRQHMLELGYASYAEMVTAANAHREAVQAQRREAAIERDRLAAKKAYEERGEQQAAAWRSDVDQMREARQAADARVGSLYGKQSFAVGSLRLKQDPQLAAKLREAAIAQAEQEGHDVSHLRPKPLVVVNKPTTPREVAFPDSKAPGEPVAQVSGLSLERPAGVLAADWQRMNHLERRSKVEAAQQPGGAAASETELLFERARIEMKAEQNPADITERDRSRLIALNAALLEINAGSPTGTDSLENYWQARVAIIKAYERTRQDIAAVRLTVNPDGTFIDQNGTHVNRRPSPRAVEPSAATPVPVVVRSRSRAQDTQGAVNAAQAARAGGNGRVERGQAWDPSAPEPRDPSADPATVRAIPTAPRGADNQSDPWPNRRQREAAAEAGNPRRSGLDRLRDYLGLNEPDQQPGAARRSLRRRRRS